MKKAAKKTPRLGGRPNAQQAEQLRGLILATATELFLRDGYGATSIDAVAKLAGISKRTFYHRFKDKADLFGAVITQLVTSLRPPQTELLFEGPSFDIILCQVAKVILHAALTPRGLALHRIIIAEAARFPELAILMETHGARAEAIRRLADLFQHYVKDTRPHAEFAAAQFLHLVTAAPQRRALGMGTPMTEREQAAWVQQTVILFLKGYNSLPMQTKE